MKALIATPPIPMILLFVVAYVGGCMQAAPACPACHPPKVFAPVPHCPAVTYKLPSTIATDAQFMEGEDQKIRLLQQALKECNQLIDSANEANGKL